MDYLFLYLVIPLIMKVALEDKDLIRLLKS